MADLIGGKPAELTRLWLQSARRISRLAKLGDLQVESPARMERRLVGRHLESDYPWGLDNPGGLVPSLLACTMVSQQTDTRFAGPTSTLTTGNCRWSIQRSRPTIPSVAPGRGVDRAKP